MKTLILSSCTSKKKYKVKNQLKCKDFLEDNILYRKQKELQQYLVTAFDMYKGKQHLFIKEAINRLWNKFGKEFIDFYIISAGYGLIHYNKKIVPYDCTFKNKSLNEIKLRSTKLNIQINFKKIIKNYDLIIILLGKEYLYSIDIKNTINSDKKYYVFCGKSTLNLLPKSNNIHIIPAGTKEAKKNKQMTINLKGYIFNEITKHIIKNNKINFDSFLLAYNKFNISFQQGLLI